MKAAYSVRFREEGRGPWTTRNFATLAELQQYVRDRWEGPEYMDGSQSWHNDYCSFEVRGATLADLGHRMGERGTDDYWNWQWNDLNVRPADEGDK